MIGQRKNTAADIVVVGFALFSMFFGAGNVIFPPFLGLESGSQWVSGFATYFIADIGLAMLAMFALLRVGSSEAVVSRVGQIPAAVLMSAIILCVGPMVAIPRTSATTYEMAIVPNLSGVSPVVFSILFFALILALCIRESAVVDIVGKILTPLLLLGLFAIIIKGVITPLGEPSALPQIANVAVTGIKAGYQTMDALAALPFGIIVLQSVTAKGYDSGRKQFRVVGGSAVLAGILLLAVYMGLAYLGATVSAQYTNDIGRAQLIMAIIEALMGKVGMVLFGVVVGLACVTTAVALTSSAAAYFTELCRGKVSYKVFVIAICVFSAVVSNLGLDRIVAVAAPVLDVIYPPTLVLIVLALALGGKLPREMPLTVILVLVLAVLPQILLIGDTIVERTSFDVKVPVDLSRVNRTASGNMRVSGRVRGYVNGVIDAEIKGTLNGTLKASVTSGTTIEPTKPDFYLPESKEQAAAEWAENYTEGEEV